MNATVVIGLLAVVLVSILIEIACAFGVIAIRNI